MQKEELYVGRKDMGMELMEVQGGGGEKGEKMAGQCE